MKLRMSQLNPGLEQAQFPRWQLSCHPPSPNAFLLQTDRPLPLQYRALAFLAHAARHPQSHSTTLDKGAAQPPSVIGARN